MKQLDQLDRNNLVGEVELHYKTKEQDRHRMDCPEEAAEFLWRIWDENTLELREEFIVVLLNNAKESLGWAKISIGGKTAAIVEISQIITLALLGNASSVVISHNHPSGILRASTADVNLTKRTRDALELLSISLDDHIIITRDQFYSFRAHGLI